MKTRGLLLFAFSWKLVLLVPVKVPYFLSLGLGLSDVLELLAVFGGVVALLEVPSGLLCDSWGRRRTLVLGAAFKVAAFVVLLRAQTYTGLAAYEVLVGVAFSLVSGADVSLLYDAAVGPTKGRTALARFHLAAALGESVSAVAAGPLAALSFDLLLRVQVGAAILGLASALLLPSVPPRAVGARRGSLGRAWRCLVGRARRRFAVASFVGWSLAIYLAWWILQRAWTDAGVPLAAFGALWCGHHLLSGLAGTVASRVHRLDPAVVGTLVGGLVAAGYLLLAVVRDPITVVAVGLAFPLARGLNQVTFQDELNQELPPEVRATANSIVSLLFRGAFLVAGPLVGRLVEAFGLSVAVVLLAGAAVLVSALLGSVRGGEVPPGPGDGTRSGLPRAPVLHIRREVREEIVEQRLFVDGAAAGRHGRRES